MTTGRHLLRFPRQRTLHTSSSRQEAAGQSGLLVDELLLEREEIAFNAGSTMVSLVMRATDFARLSDAQPCRFAQAPPGG